MRLQVTYSVALQRRMQLMPNAIRVTMLYTEPQIPIVDYVMNNVPDNSAANGKPNNYIADGNDPNEDFVDSFYEVPSVFNSNNSNEMCGNCDTYFPVEQLCPVTHFCPKCQKEDREYEQQDMFANGD